MAAHEWTRARQRSVRRVGTDSVAAAVPPGPPHPESPAPPRPGTDGQRDADDVQAPPTAVETAPAAPEAEVASPEAAPENDAARPQAEEPVAQEATTAAMAPEAPPSAPAVQPRRLHAADAHPSPRSGESSRTRASAPDQPELPLGLEPVAPKPGKRSATETREELIQRLLDPHLTLQETAKLLDVCPTTVRRYTNRGLLAHYRTPGNQRRFRLSDVLAFMERQGIPAHGLDGKRSGLLPGDSRRRDHET